MKVDKPTLAKVAHLSRLNIAPSEEERLLNDLSEILTWVEKLKEVDTSNIEPMTHMTKEVNRMREDVASTDLTSEQALKNAPKKDEAFFKVPKVLK